MVLKALLMKNRNEKASPDRHSKSMTHKKVYND